MIRDVKEPERTALDAPAAAERRRLWQTLNPLHRKYVYVLARALALRQQKPSFAGRIYDELCGEIEAIKRLLDTLAPRLRDRARSPASRVDPDEPPS